MRKLLVVLLGGLAISGHAQASVVPPDDPAWPFWADHGRELTARKAPQVWTCPDDADEIAWVLDVRGARFVAGNNDRGYRRGVNVTELEGWPLRIRYRARDGATPLVVYWGAVIR